MKKAGKSLGKTVAAAVKNPGKFLKDHAAATAGAVVGVLAFGVCEGVLGAVTGGVGAVAGAAICGGFAGMVSGALTQGMNCAQKGGDACSAKSFGTSIVVGAIGGGVAGGLTRSIGGAFGNSLLGRAAGGAIIGGLSGAAGGGSAGALGYGLTCSNHCSAGGLVEATAEGATEGGVMGAVGHGPLKCHSFTSGTQVLMGDGTTKAIDTIKVGDEITNAVPGLAGTQAHKVTAVIVTKTDHDFADVTVKPVSKQATTPLKTKVLHKAGLGLAASVAGLTALFGLGHHTATDQAVPTAYTAPAESGIGGTLHTTYHHPFYDETQSSFVEAQALHSGDVLQTPTGTAEVTSVRLFHANTVTYDLTIGDLHTYYVEAGTTPVLVHNCDLALGWQRDGELDAWARQKENRFSTLSLAPRNAFAKMAEHAIADPNVTLHVNQAGLEAHGDFMAAAQRGLTGGEEGGAATDYEMSMIARAVHNGQRDWSSVKFYSPRGPKGEMVPDAPVPVPDFSTLRGSLDPLTPSKFGYCHHC